MTAGKPFIRNSALVAFGFAMMSAFAATLLPVWMQAVAFDSGAFAAVMGTVSATWNQRWWWGKSMIGSLLVLGLAVILGLAAMLLGWFSVQGIKGAFRAEYQPQQAALPPVTPQSLRDAFVEAFDLVRKRDIGKSEAVLLPAPPKEKKKPKRVKLLPKPKQPVAEVASTATTQPSTAPALPPPAAVQTTPPAPSPYQPPAARQLTIEQQKILIAALSPLSSKVDQSRITYVLNDSESLSFANNFFKVFQLAGLKPDLIAESIALPSDTGLLIEVGKSEPKEVTATIKSFLDRVGVKSRVVVRDVPGPSVHIFVSSQPL